MRISSPLELVQTRIEEIRQQRADFKVFCVLFLNLLKCDKCLHFSPKLTVRLRMHLKQTHSKKQYMSTLDLTLSGSVS